MISTLEIQEILKLLPHRYPLLLVDRVLELDPGQRIVGLKNVTINEPFFPGHFPQFPVMPGVMILEAMAQTAALLAFKSEGIAPVGATLVLFVGIDNARFKRQVVPGDQLRMEIVPTRNKGGIWKCDARALVEGQLACTAELMCTFRKPAC
jgi:3-hydroxyacyl-[acyl-carrier-protein] dehydratase